MNSSSPYPSSSDSPLADETSSSSSAEVVPEEESSLDSEVARTGAFEAAREGVAARAFDLGLLLLQKHLQAEFDRQSDMSFRGFHCFWAETLGF